MRRFGAGWSEEVPGLAIFFVLRSLRLWVDEQRLPVFDFRNGKNVPGVFRENVGDEEVDLVGSVWKFEPVYGCNSIVLALRRFRPYRFDLDAPENFAGAKNDVVSLAFSPGLGDGKAQSGGFAHKGELGELATMLVVEPGRVRELKLKSFF